MTISSTSNKSQFNGSGTSGPFPFSYKVFSEGDLSVILTSPSLVDTQLVIVTDYTVSLNADQNNDPGGTVSTVESVGAGYSLTVLREIDSTQETDITNGGGFYPEVIENALDKLTMLCQQNSEVISRAIVSGVAAGATTPEELLAQILAASESTAEDAASAAISAGAAEAAASSIPADVLIPDDIGTTVQAYDADTAKTDVAQTFTAPQRTQETTDNDGSFDCNINLDFECTPTAGFTLTFTNIPASPTVQRGSILLINGANYAVAAHANTKVTSSLLTTISATGTYILAYETRNGLAYVTSAGAFA